MKLASKRKTATVKLNAQDFHIDARIWEMFKEKAGTKGDACMLLASDLVAQGKTPERALADALDTFKLA
jgi:hypothetical protein